MHWSSFKTNRAWLLLAAASVALLGHLDTAQAQSLVVNPNPLVVGVLQSSGAPKSTTVNVSTPSGTYTLNASVTKQIASSAIQLGFSSSTVGPTPVPFQISIDSSQVPVVGASGYDGVVRFQATAPGQATLTTDLPVHVDVYANVTVAAAPASLTFPAQVNGPSQSQQLSISSQPGGVVFNAAAQTVPSGQSWLTVLPTPTFAPGANMYTVTVNPAGLAIGTYTGFINVSAPSVQPLQVPVTLTVSAQPSLTLSTQSLPFYYQLNSGNVPQASTFTVGTNSNVPVPFTTSVVSDPGACGNWLSLTSPVNATTPATVTLNAIVTGLSQPATCTGTITVNGGANVSNAPQTVRATLVVSTAPGLLYSASNLAFTYQIGTPAPAPQTITFSSTADNVATGHLQFQATAADPWLIVSTPTNPAQTPAPLTVSINPAGLLPRATPYTSNITVTSFAGNGTITIPVSVLVTNTPQLTVNPQTLNFNYQLGYNNVQPVSFTVGSTGPALPFTVTPSGSNFFTVSQSSTTTPSVLTLTPNVGAFTTPQTYTASVVLTAGGVGAGNSVTVPVTLTVSNTPLVNIAPGSLTIITSLGATPPAQTVTLRSTADPAGVSPANSALQAPVQVTTSTNFIGLFPTPTSTPGSFTFAITTPAAAGTYNGSITVTSGTNVQVLPVTLIVTNGVTLAPDKQSLSFTQATAGAAPASQVVNLAVGAQTVALTASAYADNGGTWLSASVPTSGTGNIPVTISVNGATLAPGTYTGTVSVLSLNAVNPVVNIAVTLTVVQQSLASDKPSLSFAANLFGPTPATQTLQVTSTSTGSVVSFTAASSVTSPNGGTWLTVNNGSTTGTLQTPAALTIGVNPAGLQQGTYTGTINITNTVSGSTPLSIPVTLTVGAQNAAVVSQLYNAASVIGSLTGPVSPGEILTLKGTGLGPVTAVIAAAVNGAVSGSLANVSVTFDGVAAPLLYVQNSQINLVVPYEVQGKTTTQMVVSYNSVAAAALPLSVTATAPGIFSLDPKGTGTGQAAVLNQDFTVNAAGNAAARGSVIQIFATGEGQTNPGGVTGQVIPVLSSLKKPAASVSVTIGGIPANVEYAGSAPGGISGFFQVNATVPAGVNPGAAVPIFITVGGVQSQVNATIAVQ